MTMRAPGSGTMRVLGVGDKRWRSARREARVRYWMIWSVGVAATALLGGCALSGGPPMPAHAPNDFSVIQDWREGSLPPPYFSRYQIRLGPDGAGVIEYHLGYDPAPAVIETFTVARDDLEALYAAMVREGVFTGAWTAHDRPPVGGSSTSLVVVAAGRRVEIPSFLGNAERARAAATLHERIKTLVPARIWAGLQERQRRYQAEYGATRRP
jgi:hypothetical protein